MVAAEGEAEVDDVGEVGVALWPPHALDNAAMQIRKPTHLRIK